METKNGGKKRIAAVVFWIHISTPRQHIAKLFIRNVPSGITEEQLKVLLTEAGYRFGEFRTPWTNYYVSIGLRDMHPQVKGAYRRGNVETIDFEELCIDWED